MGTDILKSYTTLQGELESAKNSLKGVDESIKRLIGRDPTDFPPSRQATKRGPQKVEERNRGRVNPVDNRAKPFSSVRSVVVHENHEPPQKKRTTGVSVFKRLSDRPVRDEKPRGMISKIIVTPKEVPSREEALEAQSKTDEKSKARNRRMFGALLGTLQKFQQEETKLKKKEDKRAQLEKKIEEHEIKEKEEVKKERQELFLNRKRKQSEIKMLELKMIKMKDYASWEARQKPRQHYIKTKTKPHLYYLPRKLTEETTKLLEESKIEIEQLLEEKKNKVQEDLIMVEERMKRYFEPRENKNEPNPMEDEDEDIEEAMETNEQLDATEKQNGDQIHENQQNEVENHENNSQYSEIMQTDNTDAKNSDTPEETDMASTNEPKDSSVSPLNDDV